MKEGPFLEGVDSVPEAGSPPRAQTLSISGQILAPASIHEQFQIVPISFPVIFRVQEGRHVEDA